MRYLTYPALGRGFTMLEALISLLILSFGLLGIAGLYIAGVQNNKSASLRTIATQQSYDMADRMRANLAGLTVPQAAAALGVSPRTADADWAYARAWLLAELRGDGPGRPSP